MASDLSTPWEMLPDEMVLTILDLLAPRDVQALSKINTRTQNLCVPALFRTVSLPTLPALSAFICAVPTSRRHLIRELDICTKPTADYDSDQNVYDDELATTDGTSNGKAISATDTLIELLTTTPVLEHLSLSIAGALGYDIIPVLESLTRVKHFALRNYAREEVTPLSERLAVRLAFCFPSLSSLSLTRITRSAIQAPELHGVYPYVPIVNGDAAVPPAPYPICDMLRLPALLRIKTLRKLRIRDTHLGDPLWDETAWDLEVRKSGVEMISAIAPLEVLDLGACALESPAFNERCTMRILSNVRSTITSFAVSGGMATGMPISDVPPQVIPPTAIPLPSSRIAGTQRATTARPTNRPSLPLLKTLHLTPLLSPSALAPTLAQPQFALSPVHTLACTFHPDDAADGCAALAEFLGVNRSRSSSATADRNICAERMRGEAHTHTHSHFSALRTIRVAIASEEKPISPSPRLSARAAARLRAEQAAQRVAAVRLRALCKELGLEASIAMAGCDEIEQEVRVIQSNECGERRVVFAEPVAMETGGCAREGGSTSTSCIPYIPVVSFNLC